MNAHFITSLRAVVLAAAFGLFSISPAAHGQPAPAASALTPGEPVKVNDAITLRAAPMTASVEPGGRLVVAVEITHAPKYHLWPAAGVKLPADIEEFAIRTELGLPKNDAGGPIIPAWIARLDGVQWPEAHPGKVADPSGEHPTVTVPLYSDIAVAFVRLEVAKAVTPGDMTLNLALRFQACNEQTCLMPEDVLLPVKVKIVAKGATSALVPPTALFKDYDASLWGKGPAPQSASATPPQPTSTPTPPTSGVASAPTKPTGGMSGSFFGVDLGTSFLLLFLFAVLGGFLLNLTPCVLPVIPIKVLTLTQHAKTKRQALVLGLWMALGVVAFWAAAGIPMAFISVGLDPSRYIFGVWWITLIIGLIITLMGLGIMGLFNINLPQSVYAVEAKADSPSGSFLFGVMTAVLGLPCFGFVVGGLLAGAATLPSLTIMAVFVGIGVGMAAPYLILAVWPDLLKFIPRTGPASELLKQVMGIILIAAAAYFIAAGLKALTSDYPYITGSIGWWAVAFFIAVAGVWMIIRTFQITRRLVPRVAFPIIALLMVLGIGIFAQGKFIEDRENYNALAAASTSTGPSAATVPAGVWMKYSPELFAALRSSNRPVFLDFTADWCINCKALHKLLLAKGAALERLKASNVVLLEVDCTSTRAKGWDLLRDLGRTGVPTWVVYGPATGTTPVVIDLTTPTVDTLLVAIDKAGIPKPPLTGQPSPATSTALAPSNPVSLPSRDASLPVRDASR